MNLNDLDESLRSEKPYSAKPGVAEGSNDYFKRRKDEEDRIAGAKAPAKRTPKQTDYEKKRKQQGVAEMDKSQPSHGRDGKISHSTYGSRDKGGSSGPERTAKATTANKMMKHAHDIMMKTMSDADKVKKGWRNPNMNEQGVAEGLPQTLRKVVPGYAKREIDKKMDAGKFGKTDADKDANFQRYKKIQDKLKEQGVAEAGYSGADDTDTVGFSVNSERAYQAVMARFGDHIDHDETSGIMYVPARMWPNVEVVAFDADGEGATQADGSDELAEGDDFHAVLAFADGRQQSLRLANPINPVKQVLSYMIRRRDVDALKRLVTIDGINVKNIISQLMAGRSNQVNLESRVASMNNAINHMLEAAEKIGGRHTPADFDAMVGRVRQQAKQGPMQTVWDPVKRVYKNVPVNKK